MATYSPLKELIVARTKDFFREPEAIFWVYIFPILLMVGLGIAFRTGGQTEVRVDVVDTVEGRVLQERLSKAEGFRVELLPLEEARARYAAGKIDLIVSAAAGSCEYIYDPSRLGTEAAKIKTNDVIQSGAGRKDALSASEQLISEPGSRYIDWLIPGLMGMNIMGGGMWGLGFVTVDMRMRKLLKRFVATPMKRSDFLLALMGSRILFLLTEMAVILGVGYFFFELSVRGSLLAVGAVMVLGAICFGGLGLLVACRTDKIETVSGILNVVMLPMYLLSGIFFSSERFPDSMQPLVQALPLTQLNNALRAIILEGMPLESQWLPALALAGFGIVSFALALRWFRWQ